MQIIPLAVTANQSFNLNLDGNDWIVTLKTTNGVISCSLILNSVVLIDNMRVVANTRIIPAIYQENGNFLISTIGNDLPSFDKFSDTQQLIYLSPADILANRRVKSSRITKDFFVGKFNQEIEVISFDNTEITFDNALITFDNGYGGSQYPQRFQPRGYT